MLFPFSTTLLTVATFLKMSAVSGQKQGMPCSRATELKVQIEPNPACF